MLVLLVQDHDVVVHVQAFPHVVLRLVEDGKREAEAVRDLVRLGDVERALLARSPGERPALVDHKFIARTVSSISVYGSGRWQMMRSPQSRWSRWSDALVPSTMCLRLKPWSFGPFVGEESPSLKLKNSFALTTRS